MPFAFNKVRKHFKNNTPFVMLISQHNDGRIAADIVRKLGITSVAGSSTRGGKEALKALKVAIEEGNHVGFTPDGPKGPIYKMKPGAVRLAQLTNAPLYPMTISASNAYIFEKSWDKMLLPKPFSKVTFLVGQQIHSQNLKDAENALQEITLKSDSLYIS